jgi:hypothetical protein
MLYAFLGSVLAGSLATVWTLWRKSKVETALKGAQKDLEATRKEIAEWIAKHTLLTGEYNSLVDHANAQIAQLNKEKEDLLDALQKSGKPGVFADLLRSRNTKA